ncbi:hypothetical protein R3P38DRAFT_2859486 [Favolaschia claudopus]|uniref:Uncharacterized protein n=1 Tax=Favolaschia claudopus TaxID=2862362 RepID=A0AAW0DKS8_9AGAR
MIRRFSESLCFNSSNTMFSAKSLLFIATAATLLSSVAGQFWEVMVYEPTAGGTNQCTGGGTTISGSDTADCHVVGIGSDEVGFKVIQDQGPPFAEFAFDLFSDTNCQESLGVILGPNTCFSGDVGSFEPVTVPTRKA